MKREDWREILSQRDWRRLLPYAPVAAVIVVIVAALGTDLAFGGPSKPKVDNTAPPPEVVRATIAAAPVSPTPYVPPPTATPTAAPTALPEFITQSRDKTRMDDLAKIAAALEQYREQEGEYPIDRRQHPDVCARTRMPTPAASSRTCSTRSRRTRWATRRRTATGIHRTGRRSLSSRRMDSPANATPDKCEQRFVAAHGEGQPLLRERPAVAGSAVLDR